jgi:hypothetical protein
LLSSAFGRLRAIQPPSEVATSDSERWRGSSAYSGTLNP